MVKYRDSRKLYTFKVKLRGVDLDNLEDLLGTIPVCDDHKGLPGSKYNGSGKKDITERDLMTQYYICKNCRKVHDAHMNALKRVYSQLCRQYFKGYP
jgi:hypothetical protein